MKKIRRTMNPQVQKRLFDYGTRLCATWHGKLGNKIVWIGVSKDLESAACCEGVIPRRVPAMKYYYLYCHGFLVGFLLPVGNMEAHYWEKAAKELWDRAVAGVEVSQQSGHAVAQGRELAGDYVAKRKAELMAKGFTRAEIERDLYIGYYIKRKLPGCGASVDEDIREALKTAANEGCKGNVLIRHFPLHTVVVLTDLKLVYAGSPSVMEEVVARFRAKGTESPRPRT